MKKLTVLAIVCLLLSSAIVASEYDSEADEIQRKTRALNELAERFKAETGFEGDITYNHQYMRFSRLYGTFNDIHLAAPCDTVLAGQAIDQIMLRFTPFTLAREGQLVLSRHINSRYMVTKVWKQLVNGYSVHPGGIISISYNIDTQEFIISDSSVDIPNTPIPINISKEDAKQIMLDEYSRSEDRHPYLTGRSQEPSIGYLSLSSDGIPSPYRLYWSMGIYLDWYCIDVETLQVHHGKVRVHH
jgi:hypothetical protein